MVELKGGNPELRALSREASSQLLRTTVLRAIRPRRGATESREVFERRLGRELRRLRRALLAQPQQWLVTLPVHGFYKGGLPFTFGGIAFQQCDDTATRALAARIGTFEPRRRVREEKVRAENRARRRFLEEFVTGFVDHDALATATVSAVDHKAAERIGGEKIHRAVDIINFFAPMFHVHLDSHRASVPPDAPRRLNQRS
jgi:hypothetical protein